MKSFVFKDFIIILLVISIVGIIVSCSCERNKNIVENSSSSYAEKYGLFLFNTSCSFYTYFIEIVDSVTVTASAAIPSDYEAIYNNNKEKMRFYHGREHKERFIDTAKISALKQEMEQITDIQNPFLKSIYSNTWAGILMYGNKYIIFILSDHTDDDIGKLVRKFVEISPIPIELYSYGCWPVSNN